MVPSDKKVPQPFDWRRATELLIELQKIKEASAIAQDAARIVVPEGAAFVALSDTHVCSWGTDHERFVEITDQILSIPDLYVCLLGDLIQSAIRLSQGVAAVSDNMLPFDMQLDYLTAWYAAIEHKILLATWDNHTVEREEEFAGRSVYAMLSGKNVVYHDGIGHPDLVVGDETYKLAVSHRFRGRSQDNPCQGGVRYLVRQAPSREIALSGDSHNAGILSFWHEGKERLVVNSGSLQTDSLYAKRHFTLYTPTVFPVVELWPDVHGWATYRDVPTWLKATRRG